jgi:hypothetical protein
MFPERGENPLRPAVILGKAKGQTALFAQDTHFVVSMNAKDSKPSQEPHSRDALAPLPFAAVPWQGRFLAYLKISSSSPGRREWDPAALGRR